MGLPIKSALLQFLLLLLLLSCCVVQTSSTPIDGDTVNGDLRSLAANLAPMYLPVSVSPSSPCGQALKDMATSLASNSSLWAYKFVDSWGKTLDGIGMLNYHFFGNYDECVHTAAGSVTGKYCTVVTYMLKDKRTTPRWPEVIPWRPDAPWVRDVLNRDIRTASAGIKIVPVTYSTCMPSVCTRQELQESLTKLLLPQGVNPEVSSCAVLNPHVEFTTPDIGLMGFLVFLVVLVVCASLVDMWLAYTGNRRLPKGVLRYLLVFSAYTNLGKIFQVNPSPAPGTISCLHGMRVLSMTWVIYCHEISIPMLYMVNIASFLTSMRSFVGQVILNGYPSVDTFFFLSGLLVSYSVLRAAKRTRGRFNVPLYFVHRYIRLVPAMCIVLGLAATVLRFTVSGPVASHSLYWYNICKNNWWKDILFVSNFMQETGDCLGTMWYLGVDMQLYLVGPIIILPLYHYKTSASFSLKSTDEILDILKTTRPSNILASMDVEYMFTNVPVDATIDLICKRIYDKEEPKLSIPENLLRLLLQACTKEDPFYGPDNNMYVHRDGVAMGSPLGVLFANFYMGHLEEEILTRHPQAKPAIYARYVEDIFISPDTENQIHDLVSKFKENSFLNFTYEV